MTVQMMSWDLDFLVPALELYYHQEDKGEAL